MSTTKLLKSLLSESYETEKELTDLIKECFKEMFKEHGDYAFSVFEDDLQSGREYNGCLQSIDYYKQQIKTIQERAK